jgi:hypothetical protein
MRQESRASPQVRHKGPDRTRTRLQHVEQIGPASGVFNTHAPAAQRAESVTDSSAFIPYRHTRSALRSPRVVRDRRRRGSRC